MDDRIEIGTSFTEDVPITKGWIGFTNKIRKYFGRPVLTHRVTGVRFEPGIVILPGVNRFVIHPDLIVTKADKDED